MLSTEIDLFFVPNVVGGEFYIYINIYIKCKCKVCVTTCSFFCNSVYIYRWIGTVYIYNIYTHTHTLYIYIYIAKCLQRKLKIRKAVLVFKCHRDKLKEKEKYKSSVLSIRG